MNGWPNSAGTTQTQSNAVRFVQQHDAYRQQQTP